MKTKKIISDCKNQLENAFYNILESAEMKRIKNRNKLKDEPMIIEYLNNVQDSIIKDLHPSIKEDKKERIIQALENYNIELRIEIN